MISLIKHFLNYPENLSGLRDCHVKSVDSILLDAPSTKLRVFIAKESHELWKNIDHDNQIMSVGYHNHHCDVSLHSLKGIVHNILIKPDIGNKFSVYNYQSKIGTRYLEGKFEFIKHTGIRKIDNGSFGYVFMDSTEFHTIYVEKGKMAAWLVIEGKEDPDYRPVTISNNHNLERSNFRGFYGKMSIKECVETLRKVI